MMHPEKAPGSDGMTALFFQHSWHIIKEDLVVMVNNFLVSWVMDPRLNTLNICMIPKMERLTRMTKLRPIGLFNVGYKIILKVLCKAYEIFHGLRTNKECQRKYMTIKTDMSKAYDRVEWNFIQALLQKLGFDPHWIKLMIKCISSVQYRVIE